MIDVFLLVENFDTCTDHWDSTIIFFRDKALHVGFELKSALETDDIRGHCINRIHEEHNEKDQSVEEIVSEE